MNSEQENTLPFCVDKTNEEILALNIPQPVLNYWNSLAMLLPPDFTHSRYLNLLLYRKNESGPAAQIIRCGSLRDIGNPSREVLGVQDEVIISNQSERSQLNFQFYTDTRTFKTLPEFFEEDELIKAFLDISNELVLTPGSSIIIRNSSTVFVSDGESWIKGDSYQDAVKNAQKSQKMRRRERTSKQKSIS